MEVSADMHLACGVVEEPAFVARRLAELGLTVADAHSAVTFGAPYVVECTGNDVASAPGMIGYLKMTRGLRDRLVPLGGRPGLVRRQPCTITPANVSVVIAAGSAETGRVGPMPHTRSEKGPATEAAIQVNNDQVAFDDIDRDFAAVVEISNKGQARQKVAGGMLTWFLLYFIDEASSEIRVELSLPSGMDEFVDAWLERIILPSIPLNRRPQESVEDNTEIDTTIEIKRRHA